jgi:O-antigen/teichoic acid export membrane protein
MDLFSNFKKDYLNYLISIILPSLISGLSIPVFKHLLGARGYGKFSIWLNAILIITAILSGWIAQSIIRFFPASKDKGAFSRQAITVSLKTQCIFFIPVFLVVWYVGKDISLALLCSLALFATSIQFTVLPIIQSSFLSKKIISSETIRILTYVIGAVLLLKFTGISYLYSLFIAVFASYLFSLLFLIKQALRFFKEREAVEAKSSEKIKVFKNFFRYGAPLSLWFVFVYLFSYVDKLFMFKYLGAEIQGNYQAIFDLLNRGITLVISPIVTSLFPLLTASYIKGDRSAIRNFLKKIIIYELCGFAIVVILYWWFGANLLFVILKTPNNQTFRWIGFIVICGTFMWQLAILVQKRFELQLKTFFLLLMVAIAFFTQITFYMIFKDSKNELVYPFGFFLSSFIYLFLVSFSELLVFSKSIFVKSRLSK